jgi:hypothetical protein
MLRSVEDCWRTAAGGHVTQLVEDGGRLIELPVGGGVGKAKEGSGREGKEDGVLRAVPGRGQMEVPAR